MSTSTQYSTTQVAALLGCSLRSLYRWEQNGVIPPARRVDRGGVSVRVYTGADVEAIRRKVAGRMVYTAIFEPPRQRLSRPGVAAPRRIVVPKDARRRKRGRAVEVRLEAQWAAFFVQAIEAAQKEGCRSVTLTTASGRKRTFGKDNQQ